MKSCTSDLSLQIFNPSCSLQTFRIPCIMLCMGLTQHDCKEFLNRLGSWQQSALLYDAPNKAYSFTLQSCQICLLQSTGAVQDELARRRVRVHTEVPQPLQLEPACTDNMIGAIVPWKMPSCGCHGQGERKKMTLLSTSNLANVICSIHIKSPA